MSKAIKPTIKYADVITNMNAMKDYVRRSDQAVHMHVCDYARNDAEEGKEHSVHTCKDGIHWDSWRTTASRGMTKKNGKDRVIKREYLSFQFCNSCPFPSQCRSMFPGINLMPVYYNCNRLQICHDASSRGLENKKENCGKNACSKLHIEDIQDPELLEKMREVDAEQVCLHGHFIGTSINEKTGKEELNLCPYYHLHLALIERERRDALDMYQTLTHTKVRDSELNKCRMMKERGLGCIKVPLINIKTANCIYNIIMKTRGNDHIVDVEELMRAESIIPAYIQKVCPLDGLRCSHGCDDCQQADPSDPAVVDYGFNNPDYFEFSAEEGHRM